MINIDRLMALEDRNDLIHLFIRRIDVNHRSSAAEAFGEVSGMFLVITAEEIADFVPETAMIAVRSRRIPAPLDFDVRVINANAAHFLLRKIRVVGIIK
jgi:hypothetical protein